MGLGIDLGHTIALLYFCTHATRHRTPRPHNLAVRDSPCASYVKISTRRLQEEKQEGPLSVQIIQAVTYVASFAPLAVSKNPHKTCIPIIEE